MLILPGDARRRFARRLSVHSRQHFESEFMSAPFCT
jgi:hypothetical protein